MEGTKEYSEVCGSDEIGVAADDDGEKLVNDDEAMGISLFMNGSSKIDTVGCSVIMSVTEVGIEDCKIFGDGTDMGVKVDCLIVGCNEETVVSLLLGIADDSVIGMMIGNKAGVGADGIVLE